MREYAYTNLNISFTNTEKMMDQTGLELDNFFRRAFFRFSYIISSRRLGYQ